MATRPPCLVCKSVEGKYRCPRCDDYTCSVACSREHRDNHPSVEEKPKIKVGPGLTTANSQPPSEQKVPTKLSDIADTPEYKALCQRYPDLQQYLLNIAKATDPPKSSRGGAGSRKANQPWTQEEGLSNAVRLVQAIKTSPGDVRDAVREFSDLVNAFKTKLQEPNEKLRKDRAERDAQIIAGLLREEEED
ncbi:hypothetical protein GGR50DRAFT_42528 [Xylaria sp. CBS 124048]|nr:hypothetical protein GGR50DRAFT_42528 [Xylaria sp. CBS 124048]